jgi:hypothetical protein
LDDPCIVFALRWEARAFLRIFRPGPRFPGTPFPLYRCDPPPSALQASTICLAEIGVGQAGEAALAWLLRGPRLGDVTYRPRFFLSAGYSGGLRDDYRVGDVILASEVVDLARRTWPTTWPTGRTSFRRERLLTVAEPACEPDAKTKLAVDYNAGAVDMETALVARLCAEHGVPFGCVRVISDARQTRVPPELIRCFEGSRLSVPRLLGQLMRAPRMMKDLWWMARDARRAGRSLADALVKLLTEGSGNG